MEFDLKRTFRSVQEAVRKLDKAMAAGTEEPCPTLNLPSTVLIGGKSVTHSKGSAVRQETKPFRKQPRTERKQEMLTRLFSSEAIFVRYKIQQYCERIIVNTSADTIEYSRKAEDILWRKCFYEVILLARKNLKYIRPNSSLEGHIRSHLVASNGIYHGLLLKLQTELNVVPLGDCLDVPSNQGKQGQESASLSHEDKDLSIWFLKCIHRCLCYLGDLARYQQDFDGTRSSVMACRYYGQAVQFLPEFGLPHNQLGTLSGNRNYGIDATYHYLRCLLSPHPFEGASANLKRLFQRNHRRHMDILRRQKINKRFESTGVSRYARVRRLKRCLIGFLDLMGVLLHNQQRLGLAKLQQICLEELRELNSCLYLRPDKGRGAKLESDAAAFTSSWEMAYADENRPAFLDSSLIFKMVVLATMVVRQLQEKVGLKESDSANDEKTNRLSVAHNFTIIMFSHLLRHSCIRVTTAINEGRHRLPPSSSETKISVKSDDSGRDLDVTESSSVSSLAREPDAPPPKESLGMADVNSRLGAQRGTLESLVDKDLREEDPVVVRRRKMLSLMRRRRRRRRKRGEEEEGDERDDDSSEEKSGEGEDDESDLSEGDLDLTVVSEEEQEDEESEEDEEEGQYELSKLMERSKTHPDEETEESETKEKGAMDKVASGESGAESLSEEEPLSDEEEKEESKEDSDSKEFERAIKIMKDQGILMVVKVVVDWLRAHLHTVPYNCGGIEALWYRLALLLNRLPNESDVLAVAGVSISARLSTILKSIPLDGWNQTFPLPEDLSLQNLIIFKEFQTKLLLPQTGFDYLTAMTNGGAEKDFTGGLTSTQECLLRLCAIRHFGYFASKKKEFVGFRFLPDQKVFEAPTPPPPPPRPPKSQFKSSDSQRNREDRRGDAGFRKPSSRPIEFKNSRRSPNDRFFHGSKFKPLPDVEGERFTRKNIVLYEADGPDVIVEGDDEDDDVIQLTLNDVHIEDDDDDDDEIIRLPPSEISLHPRSASNDVDAVKSEPIPVGDARIENGTSSSTSPDEARRQQLMKGMAQLRLKSEVSKLENAMPSQSLSPYLVPDAAALTNHLALLQEMADASTFILVIPSSVVNQLDEAKKSHRDVRDSIRWLETQFQKGNRFVRPQNPVVEVDDETVAQIMDGDPDEDVYSTDEASDSPPRPSKKEAYFHRRLLSCAAFFAAQRPLDKDRDGATPTRLKSSSPLKASPLKASPLLGQRDRGDSIGASSGDADTTDDDDKRSTPCRRFRSARGGGDVMVSVLTGSKECFSLNSRQKDRFHSVLGIAFENVVEFYRKWNAISTTKRRE